MPKFFNTAGPCDPAKHYMLPPERRLPGLRRLIDRELYFVVHAPRQSGKTTLFRTLAPALTESGRYAALLASCEVGQAAGGDVERGSWPYPGGFERFAIELKVWRDRRPDPREEGLIQLSGYLAKLGLSRGTLLLFDARTGAPPLPGRATAEEVEHDGRHIEILRL